MNLLTVHQVLFLHMRIVEETGGVHGVHDVPLLQSAVASSQSAFASSIARSDLFSVAAGLFNALISSQPMMDSNNCIGIAAAVIFLERNGFRLNATNPDLEAFARRAIQDGIDVEAAAAWLRENSVKAP